MKKLAIMAAAGVALLALAPRGLAAGGKGLEGRWLLVEQSYGRGESNLVSDDEPVILEVLPGPGGLAGRWIDPGGDPSAAPAWPAWRAEGRLLPVQILARSIEPAGGTLRASYRVAPSEGDALVLEVSEAYELESGGDALTGTVKVVFRAEGGTRGSYTLSRRFERLP